MKFELKNQVDEDKVTVSVEIPIDGTEMDSDYIGAIIVYLNNKIQSAISEIITNNTVVSEIVTDRRIREKIHMDEYYNGSFDQR